MASKKDKVIEMRLAGHTYKEIASALDMYQPQVYQILFKAKLTKKKGSTKVDQEARKEAVIALRKEKKTYMEISIETGLAHPTINKILREAGMTRKKDENDGLDDGLDEMLADEGE